MTTLDANPAHEAYLFRIAANRPDELKRAPFRDQEEAFDWFNARAAVALIGDSVRIIIERDHDHRLLTFAEAKQYFAPYKVTVKHERGASLKAAFPLWFEDGRRREFQDYGFYPGPTPPGFFNTFGGWAVTPAAGDFSLMEEHIHENICRGRAADEAYLLDWSADMFQNPLKKPGVAPVLKGEMGTGKSTFSDCLAHIIGEAYSPAVDRPKTLTGQFNGPLEQSILVRCEEGIYANDPEQRGVLKHLITSPTMMLEKKASMHGRYPVIVGSW